MECKRPEYSVIVPVYNRREEVDELLASLYAQTRRDLIEVIIVEDGSTETCKDIVDQYDTKGLNVKYFYKQNEGRSPARNHGIDRSDGRRLIFFDSDCVIPPDYFERLDKLVASEPHDCYGGPDAAHSSFSNTQKAINFAMTSFLTTGGIRGGKIRMEKFVPRTFNMGFTREVYDAVGGFREMFSEDIDMSTRIRNNGFDIGLYGDLHVYHKRRVNFVKFFRQVHVFGMSRITLQLLYPGSMKIVHLLPSLFVVGMIAVILLSIFNSAWWLILPAIYLILLFISALYATRSLKIALLAIPASLIQLIGYGTGLIRAAFVTYIMGRGRNIKQEVEMRRGK